MTNYQPPAYHGNGGCGEVPPKQSLYVSGNMVETDRILADVGTGYYMEQNQKKTAEFLERKTNIPRQTWSLCEMRKSIDMKCKNQEIMDMVMRRKISEIENGRAEFRGGEEQGAVAQA